MRALSGTVLRGTYSAPRPACLIQHEDVAPTPQSGSCRGRTGSGEFVVRPGARAVSRDPTARHAVAPGVERSRATVSVGPAERAPPGRRLRQLAVARRSGALEARAGRAGWDRHNDGRTRSALHLRALRRRVAAAPPVCPSPVQ